MFNQFPQKITTKQPTKKINPHTHKVRTVRTKPTLKLSPLHKIILPIPLFSRDRPQLTKHLPLFKHRPRSTFTTAPLFLTSHILHTMRQFFAKITLLPLAPCALTPVQMKPPISNPNLSSNHIQVIQQSLNVRAHTICAQRSIL